MAWVSSWFHPRGEENVLLNPHGLTEKGSSFIQSLAAQKIWIDLSHASEASLRSIYTILDRYQQTPLYSHSMLRSFYPGERALSEKQLIEIKKRKGIVGLIPSEDVIQLPRDFSEKCAAGPTRFLNTLKKVSSVLDNHSVGIGSDVDAPMRFLGPDDCLNEPAFSNYRDMSRLLDSINQNGIRIISAQDFLARCPSQ
jgi:microsomal dipeptidase-like Zn-dependent dipeptidase